MKCKQFQLKLAMVPRLMLTVHIVPAHGINLLSGLFARKLSARKPLLFVFNVMLTSNLNYDIF